MAGKIVLPGNGKFSCGESAEGRGTANVKHTKGKPGMKGKGK